MRPSVLIIYTGGTIGMAERPEDGSLVPINFDELSEEIPSLENFGYEISSISFQPVIDSSNITPEFWFLLANTIQEQYDAYDGFVVLHGTDTMSYTASALSFMLDNLDKPIVLTGSQLPIGKLRTDGKENLLTAVEIAAAQKNGEAIVPEVCIYFDTKLFRGNRTSKVDSEQFRAFESTNYPPLAKAGIDINYHTEFINKNSNHGILRVNGNMCTDVVILKIFPGIQQSLVEAVLNIENLKGVVLESFGAGNVPGFAWLSKIINDAAKKGIVIVNVSQCAGGKVHMGLYETSIDLKNAGVVSGNDMTTESAITKLMYLLGQGLAYKEVKKYMIQNLKGEITI